VDFSVAPVHLLLVAGVGLYDDRATTRRLDRRVGF
jgi:hypothetical protein